MDDIWITTISFTRLRWEKTSHEDRVKYALTTLDEVAGGDNEFYFVREQLRLLLQNRKRYSSDMLIFASCIYYGIAAVYRSSRDSNQLVLPQSSYIRRLSLNVNNKPNIESSHSDYLRKRVSVLSDRERLVNVLSDEIHVKSGVSGGKIIGGSENTEDIANSIQSFMISLLLSKNEDIVALFPVHNIKATDLL